MQQPIGLHADRLGVDIHVIAADPAPLRNIDYVIRTAHLGVKAIVASPIAAALACLTDEERELGVALVELGAERDQRLAALRRHAGRPALDPARRASDITDDIAAAFGVRRRDAERLKCFYGSAMTSPRDNHEMIEADHSRRGGRRRPDPDHPRPADDGDPPPGRGTDRRRSTRRLKALGFTGPVGRPVVLTGGGAELKNIADYMQGVLGRTVRVGRPKTLAGLPDAHSGPAFSTLVGLACLAGSRSGDIRDIAIVAGRTASRRRAWSGG